MTAAAAGRVLVVTSGKGGVGKTTSTAALGAAFAQSGDRVAVIDFDVGLRNLDLVLGAERRVVFDLVNVVQGVAKLPQALIRDRRLENLYLLPASQTRDKDALTESGVADVIAELRTTFDWIICDSPAGIERGATLAMRYADVAIVVTNPEVSSVRDSDRIIGLLDSKTERAERGDGIDKDRDRAETALRKSAKQDYLPAILALGEFYALGAGAEPDLREAAHWYERAAERGDVQAQFFTGRFHATGDGVPPNAREAAKWFLQAAENGHPTAAFND